MKPIHVNIVSTSPMEQSRSRTALMYAAEQLRAVPGIVVSVTDLRELSIDAYPGPERHPRRDAAVADFNAADAVVIGVPVHCWGPASNAVAFLAHALDPEKGKRFRPFLILGGAGGRSALLALDGVVRTILTEIDAVIVGRPVMIAGDDADLEAGTLQDAVAKRLGVAVDALVACLGAGRDQ